jgi:Family of unknown function (DUF6011)
MNDFDHLEDLSEMTAKPTREEKKTFPCQSCAGTGCYGSVRTAEAQKCFACNGRGWFDKPYEHAMADKRAAKAKREQGMRDARAKRNAAFEAAHPGLLAWMMQQTWSGFLTDMVERIGSPHGLSERQLAAVLNAEARSATRRAERAAEREKAKVEVDLSAIDALFIKASESGLKRPIYRAEGVVISRAPEHGRNAGALYVKSASGVYLGKLQGKMFSPSDDGRNESAAQKLIKIAENPLDAAVRYGRETGTCSCCGAELTNAQSIELGIGPICRAKWGL